MAKKVRDLNPAGSCRVDLYYDEFLNIVYNALSITKKNNKPLNYIEEQFIKNQLIENGKVGFDKINDEWAKVVGVGRDKLGNPTTLRFYFLNGIGYTREASYEPKASGAYILYALPAKNALAPIIKRTTEFMTSCDDGIAQNVDAIKTPYIVSVKDEATRLSIETAVQEKQTGQAVIIVNADLSEGLKATNVAVDYVADKLLEIRDKERDHLLNKLGTMSANINKKERVQVGEVNATTGQVIDYIYTLVDTFNKQCDSYELDFKMELNNSLEELYMNEDQKEGDNNVELEDDFINN